MIKYMFTFTVMSSAIHLYLSIWNQPSCGQVKINGPRTGRIKLTRHWQSWEDESTQAAYVNTSKTEMQSPIQP